MGRQTLDSGCYTVLIWNKSAFMHFHACKISQLTHFKKLLLSFKALQNECYGESIGFWHAFHFKIWQVWVPIFLCLQRVLIKLFPLLRMINRALRDFFGLIWKKSKKHDIVVRSLDVQFIGALDNTVITFNINIYDHMTEYSIAYPEQDPR